MAPARVHSCARFSLSLSDFQKKRKESIGFDTMFNTGSKNQRNLRLTIRLAGLVKLSKKIVFHTGFFMFLSDPQQWKRCQRWYTQVTGGLATTTFQKQTILFVLSLSLSLSLSYLNSLSILQKTFFHIKNLVKKNWGWQEVHVFKNLKKVPV